MVPIRAQFRNVRFERCLFTVCACVFMALSGGTVAGTPAPDEDDPNLVPNALLLGDTGAAGVSNGVVNGLVPTAWRAFAVDGAEVSIDSMALPADTLFPGSPPTTAIRITMVAFGAAQGFDHTTHLISLDTDRFYQPSVWVRSGNSDDSDQTLQISMPLFDQDMNFFGRDPAAFSVQADSSWTQVSSPTGATVLPGEAFAHLAFRVGDDGGENSVWIALPEVTGRPVTNVVPNPGLQGDGGVSDGSVTGAVPDGWRAFAVGDGTLTLTPSQLVAGELYPGSPPTRAIRMDISGSTAFTEGLDFELDLAALTEGYRHWGEVWVRSGHAADQALSIALPLYDEQGVFLGIQPGSMGLDVPPEWTYLAGPAFTGEPGQQVNMAFRLVTVGGEGSVVIALPRVVAPADEVFSDRFE